MEEMMNGLLSNAPGYILLPLLSIYLVINIYSNFSILKEICMNIGEGIKKLTSFWQNRKRTKYDKMLMDKDYIIWQKETMRKIYAPLIEECNKHIYIPSSEEKNNDRIKGLHIVKLEFKDIKSGRIISEDYEAFSVFLGDQIKDFQRNYPFLRMFEKEELELEDEKEYKHTVDYLNDFSAIRDQDKKQRDQNKKLILEYEKMIKNTVHYPNKVGYMLKEIKIGKKHDEAQESDEQGVYVKSKVGNYYENVLQSHVLEYELYKYYMKELRRLKKEKRSNEKVSVREEPLKYLPIRRSIHEQFGEDEYKVLLCGEGRKSLLSVQILTLIKNESGSYDCLRIRRSNNVAAKAGYIQFIPSGGFEAFNDGVDKDSQRSNYSVNKVLFRELAEECFGLPEGHQYNRLSPEVIYTNKTIQKIIQGLKNVDNINECSGGNKHKKVEFEFLGITESLVGLRPEFSFIMKIDDESIISDIISNEESRFAINLIDIRDLEKPDFWDTKKNKGNDHNTGNADNDGNNSTDGNGDLEKLNCTSAGLFELARMSDLYQRLLKGGKS